MMSQTSLFFLSFLWWPSVTLLSVTRIESFSFLQVLERDWFVCHAKMMKLGVQLLVFFC